MQFFRAYNALLVSNPIATKTITSGFTFGLGDFICQKLFPTDEQKTNGYKYDFKRTATFAAIGLTFGPAFHFWYGALAAIAQGPFKNFSKMGQTLGTMAIDQTIFAVTINCSFLLLLSFFQTQSINRGVTDIQEKLWPILKGNWSVWPAAQFINFYFVPLPYRVLWANCVGLLWNVILSYLANKKAPAKIEAKTE